MSKPGEMPIDYPSPPVPPSVAAIGERMKFFHYLDGAPEKSFSQFGVSQK
jgi:hypothetical protein